MRASNLNAEAPLQILDTPPVSARIHQLHPLSIHVKRLAAFIVAFIIVLVFVVGLGFDISTRTVPRLTFPYYNALKPVPPWSEPTPIEGNHDRGGGYK